MMKKVTTSQQHQIERMEIEKRACNVIINGLPEPSVKPSDTQVVKKCWKLYEQIALT